MHRCLNCTARIHPSRTWVENHVLMGHCPSCGLVYLEHIKRHSMHLTLQG